ncbi:MAG: hypothetical protein PQJ35_04930 [Sphaerochaetaceae bacterium]|nr:hypothetical protein [Sphaerochaetaceae bacterium]
MDKNTIIAIVLSVIVIVVGLTIQTTFFPPEPVTQVETASTVMTTGTAEEETGDTATSYNISDVDWDSGIPG